MKFAPCTNCGSLHNKAQPFFKSGKYWCDHCGSKVSKAKEAK